MTRNLKPLERGGYIKVISGSADRREKEVVITQKGKAMLEQAFPMWKKVQVRIQDKLGRSRADKFIHDLCHVVHEIDQL